LGKSDIDRYNWPLILCNLLRLLGVVQLRTPPEHHIGFQCLIKTFGLRGGALSVCSLEASGFLGVNLADSLFEVVEVIFAVLGRDGAG